MKLVNVLRRLGVGFMQVSKIPYNTILTSVAILLIILSEMNQ